MELDLTFLRQLADDDEGFIREMIAVFLDETPKSLEALAQGLKAKEWNQVKHFAHKLKYPLASVGRKDLVSLLSQLEAMSIDPSRESEMRDLFQIIGPSCKATILALEKAL